MIHVESDIYEGDAKLRNKVEEGSIIKKPRGRPKGRKVVTKTNCQTIKEVRFCKAING